MLRLQKPVRWNLSPHSRFPRPRQHFAADCGELQPETDVVAKTADGIVLSAAGMLTVDQLGERWKVPDGAVLTRERMLPTFRDIGNRLPIDADGDLERFSFALVNDQWIGAFVSRNVELTGFHAGNMYS